LTTAPSPPASLAANRPFVQLMSVRVLVTLSYQVFIVAAGWHLYDLTGSALDLGYAGLSAFLPKLLLTLFAGATADRYSKVMIIGVGSLVFAAMTLALGFAAHTGSLRPQGIYLALVVASSVGAFQGPANASLLPLLVPTSMLARAIAVGSSAWQLAAIAGPSLGGLLYALPSGELGVFGACAVARLAAGLLAFVIKDPSAVASDATPSPRSSGQVGEEAAKPVASRWSEFLAGIHFVRTDRMVLGAISLDMFAVLLGGATALLPIFAKDVLQVGPEGFGMLRAAPAVGAALVALRLSWRPLGGKAGARMLACVAGFGLCTIVFGASKHFWLSMVALAGAGALDMISVVVRQTLIQLHTPQGLRGRVSAVSQVFIGASNELGEFESGVTAHWLGPVGAVVMGGIGTVLVVAFYAWRFPELRRADRLE
jgi:MFS family permease